MANIYVRSTDGNNADSGATWALAKATLAGADAIDAAGDTIWVSQVHAESLAALLTLAFAGTFAAPTKVVCGNDGAEPPTADATTATVTTTGANGMSIGATAALYVSGITFNCATGLGSNALVTGTTSGSQNIFENCKFIILSTGASSNIRDGANTGANQSVKWINCDVKFAAVGQSLQSAAVLHWNGGAVVSGGSTPTTLFSWLTASAGLLCENVDFSNFAATFNLTTPPPTYASVIFRNCKMPASWSGNLISTAFITPGRCELYNCSAGTQNYKLWIEDYAGSVKDETTIVMAGGSTDGVTQFSWKMTTNANASYPVLLLRSPEVVIRNNVGSASKTVTMQIVNDGTTLNDDEAWIEVQELGNASQPIGTRVVDAKAGFAAAAAAQTTSSVTWTTTGLASPVKQQLSVTFTPQMKGYFLCRVVLARASKTIYVDAEPVIT